MGLFEIAAAALVAIAGAFLYGRRGGKKDADHDRDKAYIETRKRMDDVSIDDDVGPLRDWLRTRSGK